MTKKKDHTSGVMALKIILTCMLIGIISPYNQVLGQSNRAKALEFYAQGGLYDAQNDPVNAIKAYLQALQYDPTSSEIHTALAADYFRIKQREEALNHAKKAVDLNPTATEAWLVLGRCHADLAKFLPARSAFERVVALCLLYTSPSPRD